MPEIVIWAIILMVLSAIAGGYASSKKKFENAYLFVLLGITCALFIFLYLS